MQSAPFMFLILLPVLGLGIFFAIRHYARLRTEAWRDLAKSKGWRFEPRLNSEQWRQWGNFPLFERGRRGRAINLVSGQTDRIDFTLQDYRYVVGSGKNSRTYHQSVVYLCYDQLKLPAFELRPERFGHKFLAVFGYQDIDFDSSPQFSSHYLLRGEYETRIRKLFASQLRRHLETNLGWSIEGHDDRLLVYRHGKRCKPEEAEILIREAVGLSRRFAA